MQDLTCTAKNKYNFFLDLRNSQDIDIFETRQQQRLRLH